MAQDIDIARIRAQYPQYDDYTDEQLVEALYSNFYSDMDREDFNRRVRYAGARYVDQNTGERREVDIRNLVFPGDPGYPEEGTVDYYPEIGIGVPQDPDGRYRRALEDARADLASSDYGVTENMADSATLGLQGPVNGLFMALGQGIQNLGGEDEYGMLDAFNAHRQAWNEQRQQFAEDRPLTALGTGVLGGFAAPGSQALGRFIAGQQGSRGLLQGQGLFNTTARSAVAGVPTGAVYGLTTSDPGEELQDTAGGAIAGGATGAALPPALRAGAAAIRAPIRGAGGMINAMSGGRVFGGQPDRRAGELLAQALRQDGVEAADIRRIIGEWMQSGVTPNLIDVLPQGGAAQRLVRGSALQAGDASREAQRYASRIEADVQDRALDLTRGLTPQEQRPAGDVVEEILANRQRQAATDYAPAYAEPVTLDTQVVSALSDEPGRAALRRARQAAVAQRRPEQVQEIDGMLAALEEGAPIPEVSTGTLDRVRIAMRGRAEQALQRPVSRDIGAGLTGRAQDISEGLENVPGLRAARDAYRLASRQAEAVDLGRTGLTATPERFQIEADVRPQAAVGYRQALEDAIGRPTEGATGTLNRISTATNQGMNLEQAFGPDVANRYRQGIGNLTEQVRGARFIDPSTGSQTAARGLDQSLVQGLREMPRDPLSAILWAVSRIQRGASLSPRDREAVVRLATQQADPMALRYQSRAMPVSSALAIPAAAQGGRSQ